MGDYFESINEERVSEVERFLYEELTNLATSFSDEIPKESIIEVLYKLLSKKDEFGNKYFKLDKEFNYTKESKVLLEAAIKETRNDLDLALSFLDITQITKEKIDVILTKMIEIVNNDKVILQSTDKVIFATIPAVSKDGKTSVLDYDLVGENSVAIVNNEERKLNSPNKHKFIEGKPSDKKTIEHILDEFSSIEKATKYGDPLSKVCTGRGFKSEDKAYIKRDTAQCTRIPIGKSGDTIIISGVFYKIGQIDNKVQSEYGNRTATWTDMMKENPKKILVDGRNAYTKTKQNLIKALYVGKLDEVEAIHKYLVAKVIENKRGSF